MNIQTTKIIYFIILVSILFWNPALFSQQGKYYRKSVSSIPVWIKPGALDNKTEVWAAVKKDTTSSKIWNAINWYAADINQEFYSKAGVIDSTGHLFNEKPKKPVEFGFDFFNKLTELYIEVDRFDYNHIPENLLVEFRNELNALNNKKIDNYDEIIPQIIENTVVKRIVDVLNDPEIQANRGLALKDESDFKRFAETKAKSFGITEDELISLMNSAYIYLPYITEIVESQNLNMIRVKVSGGIIWYQVVIPPSGIVSVRKISSDEAVGIGDGGGDRYKLESGLYKFNVDEDDIDTGEDGILCTDDDFVNDSSNLEYAFFTYMVGIGADGKGMKNGRIQTEKFGCFQFWGIKTTPSQHAQYPALEAFARNLGVHTKAIDAFKLQAQINEVEGRKFSFPLGFKEGVNLDDEFYLAQVEEDENGIEIFKKIGYSRVIKTGNNREDPTDFTRAKKLWGPRVSIGDVVLENPNRGIYTGWKISRIQGLNIMKNNTYIYDPDIFDFLDDNQDYQNYSVAELHENWDENAGYTRPVPAFSEDITDGIGIFWGMREKVAPQTGRTQHYILAQVGLILPQNKSSEYVKGQYHFIIPFDMFVMGRNFGGRYNMGFSGGLGLDTYMLSGDTIESEKDYFLTMFEIPIFIEANSSFMLTPDVHISLSCAYRYGLDPLIWLGFYTYGWLPVFTTPKRIKYPDFIDYEANNLGGISINLAISFLKKTEEMNIGQFEGTRKF